MIKIIDKNDKMLVQAVCGMEKECFPKEAWSGSMVASHFENGGTGAAELDGADAAGYILGMVCGGEAEIYRVGTREKYRKKHIAYGLVQRFMNLCKAEHVEKIFLEVRSDNEPARRLYRKCGFESIAVRENYYDNCNAVIMEKVLD